MRGEVEALTLRRRYRGQTPFLRGCWSPGSNRLRWCTGARSSGGHFLHSSLKACVRSPPPPYACVSGPPWTSLQQLRIWGLCDQLTRVSSPGSLLLGVANTGDFTDAPHHHPQPVVARQDLDGAAHGDALQADAVHLHQFVTYQQARLLCEAQQAVCL